MPDTSLEIVTRGETSLARLPNFEPHDIAELELFATFISDSALAPKDYRGQKANCMVAIIMGRELGLSPMQAIQGIAVINGRPSVWGDAMWALVISHPEFAGFDESVTDLEATCKVSRIRRGVTSSVSETFSMEDAKRGGLLNKESPWKTYPKRMMMWRARTFVARSLFADALKGLTSYEEAQDFIEGEVVRPEAPKTPAPTYTSAAPAPAAQGDQPKPATTTEPAADAVLSAEQVKEFSAAYKASGWDLEAARMFMKHTLDVNRSGAIKASQFATAMAWAKKGPPKGESTPAAQPATTTEPAAEQKAVEQVEQTTNDPAETAARDAMVRLEMGMFEQDSFLKARVKEGKTDWYRVAKDLSQKLRDAKLE